MAPTTITTVGSLGKRATKRIGQRLSKEVRETIGVQAVLDSYYNPNNKSPSPLVFWWFIGVFIASVPTTIYSTITGQNTLPATNFFGALMLIAMLGGLGVLFLAHIGLYCHAKYVNSPYKIQSPVVRE